MSNRYIVRQPIRDADDEIIGYEMVYYGATQAFSADGSMMNEYAAANTVSSLLNPNSVKSLGGKINFMTFNTMLLMKKVPKLFKPDSLVIQIDDSVVIHPLSMHFINMFARQGYKIAVNEFEFTTRYMALMDIIDYIRIDARNLDEPAMRNFIDVAKGMHKKCIVTHIEDHKKYAMAKSLMASGFEGPYVTKRVRLQPKNRNFMKSSFFKLLYEVTRDVPDTARVETMIASDPQLSYELLKIANSQYFALRNHPATVHQALTAVGFGQLKQWIYMLCLNPSEPIANDGMEEFIQLSFMRASFYRELMRFADDVPLSMGEGYLAGMLSTLPMLVEVPMNELLDKLELPEVFLRTLSYKEGTCGELYQLILSYEVADWDAVDQYADRLGIPTESIGQVYFTCVEEVGSMWDKLNTPFAI